MRCLRSLTAWLLLALWLPATLHCSLEQAGWISATDNGADRCAVDNCDVLEGGLFKSTNVAIKVPVPTVLTCLYWLTEISPEAIRIPHVSPHRSESPPGLARTWQFTARAAPLPGAPSFVS